MVIANRGLNGQLGRGAVTGWRAVMDCAGHLGIDKCSPGRNLQRIGNDEANMPVDAAAFIPPAFKPSRIDEDSNTVFFSEPDCGRYVETKRHVTTRMLIDEFSVDEDHGIAIDPAKIEPNAFGFGNGGNRDAAHVPRRIHRQIPVSRVRVASGPVEGARFSVSPLTVRQSALPASQRTDCATREHGFVGFRRECAPDDEIIGEVDRQPAFAWRRAIQLLDLGHCDFLLRWPQLKIGQCVQLPAIVDQGNGARCAAPGDCILRRNRTCRSRRGTQPGSQS